MRLIDADEFFKDFTELEPYEPISHEYDIEAEPVRHGKWNILEGMPTQCSLCGYYVKQKTYKYCPYCGARMDGE